MFYVFYHFIIMSASVKLPTSENAGTTKADFKEQQKIALDRIVSIQGFSLQGEI